MSDDTPLHKTIIETLKSLLPPDSEEVVLEFSCVDDAVELTVSPKELNDTLPHSLLQAVVDVTEWLERGGDRLRSGRYKVIKKGADVTFEASFAFEDSGEVPQ